MIMEYDYQEEIDALSGYNWVDDMLTNEQEFFTESDIESLLQEIK